MATERSLLPVPDRLAGLFEAHRDAAREQPVMVVEPKRWRRALEGQAKGLEALPERLDRASVRAFVTACLAEGDPVLAFIATQIWGYGKTNYGPSRLAAALASSRLPDALLAACDLLDARDPVGACRMLCVDHRIPQTGMAFGTKFLFFADGYRRALILDRLIRQWLLEHAQVRLSGGRDEREYAVWLLLAEGWAADLGISSADVELAIFSDALPARSAWRSSGE
jgi:hypothetical protein